MLIINMKWTTALVQRCLQTERHTRSLSHQALNDTVNVPLNVLAMRQEAFRFETGSRIMWQLRQSNMNRVRFFPSRTLSSAKPSKNVLGNLPKTFFNSSLVNGNFSHSENETYEEWSKAEQKNHLL